MIPLPDVRDIYVRCIYIYIDVFLDHCLFLHPDKLEISHPAFHMQFESVNPLIFPNTWIISRAIVKKSC
jgi:hypothetical protein